MTDLVFDYGEFGLKASRGPQEKLKLSQGASRKRCAKLFGDLYTSERPFVDFAGSGA
jgi:hypothetical protein